MRLIFIGIALMSFCAFLIVSAMRTGSNAIETERLSKLSKRTRGQTEFDGFGPILLSSDPLILTFGEITNAEYVRLSTADKKLSRTHFASLLVSELTDNQMVKLFDFEFHLELDSVSYGTCLFKYLDFMDEDKTEAIPKFRKTVFNGNRLYEEIWMKSSLDVELRDAGVFCKRFYDIASGETIGIIHFDAIHFNQTPNCNITQLISDWTEVQQCDLMLLVARLSEHSSVPNTLNQNFPGKEWKRISAARLNSSKHLDFDSSRWLLRYKSNTSELVSLEIEELNDNVFGKGNWGAQLKLDWKYQN